MRYNIYSIPDKKTYGCFFLYHQHHHHVGLKHIWFVASVYMLLYPSLLAIDRFSFNSEFFNYNFVRRVRPYVCVSGELKTVAPLGSPEILWWPLENYLPYGFSFTDQQF